MILTPLFHHMGFPPTAASQYSSWLQSKREYQDCIVFYNIIAEVYLISTVILCVRSESVIQPEICLERIAQEHKSQDARIFGAHFRGCLTQIPWLITEQKYSQQKCSQQKYSQKKRNARL